MKLKVIPGLLFILFTSIVWADPLKMYEIYNVSSYHFVNKPGDVTRQCEKFNNIPPHQKVDKVIDFENSKEINCTAVVKDNELCQLHVTLYPYSLLKVSTSGECAIQARSQRKTQRIDNLFIG